MRWRGLLLTVLDGTFLVVADSAANISRYTKHRCPNGNSGYPQLRLSALLTCGTRSVIDAVFDPTSVGELAQARTLARSLRPGMLLLADRNYAAADLLAAIAATGAHLLIRVKTGRRLPPIRRLPYGSWLSKIGALTVRVVEARIAITTTAGTHSGDYRLVTTLLDPHTHPAAELIQLYHQRWEIETAYLELKTSILGGRVLRVRTPDGIDQETHALLIVDQLLRTAMTDATDSRPGSRPGPGQLHHRPQRRPRSSRPRRRRHRRHLHRPHRRYPAPTSWPPSCQNAGSAQSPHDQTLKQQIPGPRTRHRPTQLQRHHHHQPHNSDRPALTERRCT